MFDEIRRKLRQFKQYWNLPKPNSLYQRLRERPDGAVPIINTVKAFQQGNLNACMVITTDFIRALSQGTLEEWIENTTFDNARVRERYQLLQQTSPAASLTNPSPKNMFKLTQKDNANVHFAEDALLSEEFKGHSLISIHGGKEAIRGEKSGDVNQAIFASISSILFEFREATCQPATIDALTSHVAEHFRHQHSTSRMQRYKKEVFDFIGAGRGIEEEEQPQNSLCISENVLAQETLHFKITLEFPDTSDTHDINISFQKGSNPPTFYVCDPNTGIFTIQARDELELRQGLDFLIREHYQTLQPSVNLKLVRPSWLAGRKEPLSDKEKAVLREKEKRLYGATPDFSGTFFQDKESRKAYRQHDLIRKITHQITTLLDIITPEDTQRQYKIQYSRLEKDIHKLIKSGHPDDYAKAVTKAEDFFNRLKAECHEDFHDPSGPQWPS